MFSKGANCRIAVLYKRQTAFYDAKYGVTFWRFYYAITTPVPNSWFSPHPSSKVSLKSLYFKVFQAQKIIPFDHKKVL